MAKFAISSQLFGNFFFAGIERMKQFVMQLSGKDQADVREIQYYMQVMAYEFSK